MQARLDICALRLIKKRERLARSLLAGNQVIRTTAAALYMVRGLRLLTGPLGQVAAAMGERALLQANQAAARWQALGLLRYQAAELAGTRCAPTPFSREPALCLLTPPLASSTKRERALMPDVSGPLVFLREPLARADCRGKGARTIMSLHGDRTLTQAKFSDRYEK
jgi:hypothetical protein